MCCTREGEAKGGWEETGQMHDESRVESFGETLPRKVKVHGSNIFMLPPTVYNCILAVLERY
jgi:hypothetical protein